nr:immunoglobulin light chain junction region [Macaca mulatta]
CQQGSSEPFSF